MSTTTLKRIGMIGCGTIGSQLANAILQYFSDRARLIVLHDPDEAKAKALSNTLNPHPDVLPLESIPLHCDLIIEAANSQICRDLIPRALDMGRDVMITSPEGLYGISDDLFALAREKGRNLYVPSGDIAGIDGLEAAMTGGAESVCVRVHQAPQFLALAPYVRENKLTFAEFTGLTKIFDGTAREALKAFPDHIHSVVTVSLAGMGLDRTRVEIHTGPQVVNSVYELEVKGSFGSLFTRTESVPLQSDSPMGAMRILSACAMLNEILNPVKLGN